MLLLVLVLLAALAFEYINGFHDAANAIATVVSTKVLTPRQAICLAAAMNLCGALIGVEVAKTITTAYIAADVSISNNCVLAALLAGIIWNIVTWLGGIPSSSTHALIGGLCGAALAQTSMKWDALMWSEVVDGKTVGLWPKLVKPMLLSPMIGLLLGAFVMFALTCLIHKMRPALVQKVFGKLQICSAGWMALSHGTNDAQKTMGIITLALLAATSGHMFDDLPSFLHFLKTDTKQIPFWVQAVCALTMAAGTAGGGWRIIRTMGHKMVKLKPVHGFAAETSAALVIQGASLFGIPLSTTHVISTSIMGVGAMKRLSAVKWGLVSRIVWAWVLTLPVSAFLGYWCFKIVGLFVAAN